MSRRTVKHVSNKGPGKRAHTSNRKRGLFGVGEEKELSGGGALQKKSRPCRISGKIAAKKKKSSLKERLQRAAATTGITDQTTEQREEGGGVKEGRGSEKGKGREGDRRRRKRRRGTKRGNFPKRRGCREKGKKASGGGMKTVWEGYKKTGILFSENEE